MPAVVGLQDVGAVESIEADRVAAVLESGHSLAEPRIVAVDRAAEVDDVGTALAKLFGLGQDQVERHLVGVHDLGQDLGEISP